MSFSLCSLAWMVWFWKIPDNPTFFGAPQTIISWLYCKSCPNILFHWETHQTKAEKYDLKPIQWGLYTLLFHTRRKTSVFTLTKRERQIQLDLSEEGGGCWNRKCLLPSTHLSIQMSTPLREHPHVNMKSSGHDPLESQETDSMGNQLL